jgi:hypothetical protein
MQRRFAALRYFTPLAVDGFLADPICATREVIAHHHDPVGRNPIKDGLARLDRLCGIVVEDRRPLRVQQARHRVVRDVTHVDELLIAGREQD